MRTSASVAFAWKSTMVVLGARTRGQGRYWQSIATSSPLGSFLASRLGDAHMAWSTEAQVFSAMSPPTWNPVADGLLFTVLRVACRDNTCSQRFFAFSTIAGSNCSAAALLIHGCVLSPTLTPFSVTVYQLSTVAFVVGLAPSVLAQRSCGPMKQIIMDP